MKKQVNAAAGKKQSSEESRPIADE